jgi:hypothetical protein
VKSYDVAQIKIINDLGLKFSIQEINNLKIILKWLYNQGAADAIKLQDK